MNRYLSLDMLKVVLAVMVVGIHGTLFKDINPVVSDYFVNYLFRIAVPVFFLISGYFLAGKIDSRPALLRWMAKILFLYAFWMVVYSPFVVMDSLAANPAHPVMAFLYIVVFGYHHLWYLPAMIGGATVLYLLRNLPDKYLMAIACGLYLTGCGLQYNANYLVFGETVRTFVTKDEIYRNFLFFAFPYLYAGYFIARSRGDQTPSATPWAILTVIGLGLMFAEFAANLYFNNLKTFDISLSVPIVCIGIFMLCVRHRSRSDMTYPAKLSSVIYFVHPLILEHFWISRVPSTGLRMAAAVCVCVTISPILIVLNRMITRRFSVSFL